MFFRWCGGCGSKKPGLMNMLEAQNTFVSIIHPSVLTCGGGLDGWVFTMGGGGVGGGSKAWCGGLQH
jgi:hypothetical protein